MHVATPAGVDKTNTLCSTEKSNTPSIMHSMHVTHIIIYIRNKQSIIKTVRHGCRLNYIANLKFEA